MHIHVVIASLGGGGAERSIVGLTEEWHLAGHKVTVSTLAGPTHDHFRLAPGVDRLAVGIPGGDSDAFTRLIRNVGRLRTLRRHVSNVSADIVLGFGDRSAVLAVAAAKLSGKPVVAAERSFAPLQPLGQPWELFRTVTYRWADAVVCQTERAAQWANRTVKERVPTFVIPNGLSRQFLSPQVNAVLRKREVLYVGRLVPSKRVDALVRAFAASGLIEVGWRLVVAGEGPCRPDLESQARALDVTESVEFLGAVRDPIPWLDQAGVVVLTSSYEGYPNALIEALARGCTVIAADCPVGPREILDNGRYGYLISDDLDQQLPLLLQAIAPGGQVVPASHPRWPSEDFSNEVIAGKWIEVFEILLRTGVTA